MILKVYYFGCVHGPGHDWHASPHTGGREPQHFPFIMSIDGAFPPKVGTRQGFVEAAEGQAILTYANGQNTREVWTILSFWDRSVDKRGGCNSNFVMTGRWSFEDTVSIAKEHFPDIWKRYSFKVTLFEGNK